MHTFTLTTLYNEIGMQQLMLGRWVGACLHTRKSVGVPCFTVTIASAAISVVVFVKFIYIKILLWYDNDDFTV